METPSRASATGSCSLIARIGMILAPFLTYANTWWSPAVNVTVIVLGSANLLISYFFLVSFQNSICIKQTNYFLARIQRSESRRCTRE